ncbi:protein FAM111A-like [Salmo trutta]|uniref:protein FAM111A-like n=1 Tax=Salmo trutta TaxID=8032 RepID=UPI001131691C|nr:protein FAM111A-like [Salmo trutta]
MAAMVKSEPLKSNIYPETEHCHSFSFSCPTHKITKEEITCNKPGTILRALETNDTFMELNQMDKTLKGKDIVINCCKGYIVKHFPCWLIKEDDLLTIEMVTFATDETAGDTDEETDNYVTFSIETTGGKNTKSKPILRNKHLQSYGPLCIYAKQKKEVKKALRNDGCFSNIVFEQKCQLSERLTGSKVSMGQIAKKLNGRNFEICLTKHKEEKETKKETSDSTIKTIVNSEGDTTQTSLFDPSPDSEGDRTQMTPSTLTTETSDVGESSSRRKQKRKSNPMPDHGEILKILRNQFDDLVKQMESRREDSQKRTLPEELDLMKQEFGKIRQKFSEVHRVKKLIELGAWPGGLVKQIEPISIIGSEIREEAANKYKRENGHAIFTINDAVEKNKKRYEEVMQENKDDFVTYNTSFFHGSSGSPVFDDLGRVFGMHTGGFNYEDKRTQSTQSVLEYALPLFTILQNFVIRLKEDNNQAVLTRVQEEAQKNRFLFEALFNGDEPMDMS